MKQSTQRILITVTALLCLQSAQAFASCGDLDTDTQAMLAAKAAFNEGTKSFRDATSDYTKAKNAFGAARRAKDAADKKLQAANKLLPTAQSSHDNATKDVAAVQTTYNAALAEYNRYMNAALRVCQTGSQSMIPCQNMTERDADWWLRGDTNNAGWTRIKQEYHSAESALNSKKAALAKADNNLASTKTTIQTATQLVADKVTAIADASSTVSKLEGAYDTLNAARRTQKLAADAAAATVLNDKRACAQEKSDAAKAAADKRKADAAEKAAAQAAKKAGK